MTDEQMALAVGGWLMRNWEYIVGAVITTLAAVGGGTWFLARQISGREIRMLERATEDQSTRFAEFQTIMESRIDALQEEANGLRKKVAPSPALPGTWASAADDKGAGSSPTPFSKPPARIDGADFKFGPADPNAVAERRGNELLLKVDRLSKTISQTSRDVETEVPQEHSPQSHHLWSS